MKTYSGSSAPFVAKVPKFAREHATTIASMKYIFPKEHDDSGGGVEVYSRRHALDKLELEE